MTTVQTDHCSLKTKEKSSNREQITRTGQKEGESEMMQQKRAKNERNSFSLSPPPSPELVHRFILDQQRGKRVPLCINPQSAAFKTFIRWVLRCCPLEGILHIPRMSAILPPSLPSVLWGDKDVVVVSFNTNVFSVWQLNSMAFLQSVQKGGEMKVFVERGEEIKMGKENKKQKPEGRRFEWDDFPTGRWDRRRRKVKSHSS